MIVNFYFSLIDNLIHLTLSRFFVSFKTNERSFYAMMVVQNGLKKKGNGFNNFRVAITL